LVLPRRWAANNSLNLTRPATEHPADVYTTDWPSVTLSNTHSQPEALALHGWPDGPDALPRQPHTAASRPRIVADPTFGSEVLATERAYERDVGDHGPFVSLSAVILGADERPFRHQSCKVFERIEHDPSGLHSLCAPCQFAGGVR